MAQLPQLVLQEPLDPETLTRLSEARDLLAQAWAAETDYNSKRIVEATGMVLEGTLRNLTKMDLNLNQGA